MDLANGLPNGPTNGLNSEVSVLTHTIAAITNDAVPNDVVTSETVKVPRSQHFRQMVPLEILSQFLEQVAIRYGDDYELNECMYLRGQMNGYNAAFLESLRPYYYPSKQRIYLDREPSYNSFITVIRQVCKYLSLQYRYAIIYEQSKYSIHHYIRLHQ
jgi:hypothetical protein